MFEKVITSSFPHCIQRGKTKKCKSHEITSPASWIKFCNNSGKWSSTISMSWENRDKMRPIGVWSKYEFGAWRMPFNKIVCILIDANIQPKYAARSPKIDPTAVCHKKLEKKKDCNWLEHKGTQQETPVLWQFFSFCSVQDGCYLCIFVRIWTKQIHQFAHKHRDFP